MSEGPLGNPALGAESGTAASHDQWLHAERADEAAVLVVVVDTVTEHDIGRLRGRPLAPHGRR
ncbi:hypothetical protein [Streptomyces sp. HB132]|uniref:hypothetical protein n=1 Tax=Streptomyces sp. HB132 TaxID=767388 RepID=UPI0019608BCA|nr:hypothetical protein [Streptomyces sp. HB132]MBM7439331.1 hypothetical protein [Streptomyces sp. HB132]